MTGNRRRLPRGFTLVELLVVVTIIALLAGMLVPALWGAITRAHQNAISTEITELAAAFEAYKTKKGDYPPDFTTVAGVRAHMIRSYNRSAVDVGAWMTPKSPAISRDPANLDAAEAVVFWLSLVSSDPRNPLSGVGTPSVYYDFDQTRLADVDGDGWNEYYPKFGEPAPYVYFDGRTLTITGAVPTCNYMFGVYPQSAPSTTVARNLASIPVPANSTNCVRPYRSNLSIVNASVDPTFPGTAPNATQWVAPGKFQIISAGLDGQFGVDNIDPASSTVAFKTFPSKNYYFDLTVQSNFGDADEDNLTNFSEGRTLEDSVP